MPISSESPDPVSLKIFKSYNININLSIVYFVLIYLRVSKLSDLPTSLNTGFEPSIACIFVPGTGTSFLDPNPLASEGRGVKLFSVNLLN